MDRLGLPAMLKALGTVTRPLDQSTPRLMTNAIVEYQVYD